MSKALKQIFAFLASMKFGFVLMLLVVGLSVIGSLIPQTFDDNWYIENHPNFGEIILATGLHRIFEQWYFILICVLLGICLIFAIVSRLRELRKLLPDSLLVPEDGYQPEELSDEQISLLHDYLSNKRFRRLSKDGATIYYKNRLGYFGTVLLYFSIFCILLFGGAVLGMSDSEDIAVLPGETVTLPDGSSLRLFSFQRYDETGRASSRSVLEITTPDGRSSGVREITVNTPLRFNSYRFYQFAHVPSGSITATDVETGGYDHFIMYERSFLSADGRTGIWYETVFEDWRIDDETGQIVAIFYDPPTFLNPIYYIMVVEYDSYPISRFAIPGSSIQIGNIMFEFNEITHFPIIRAGFVPHPFPTLLYISFGILVLALYLSFFHQPAVLVLKGNLYKITAAKSSSASFEIEVLLASDEDSFDGDDDYYHNEAEEEEVRQNKEEAKSDWEVDI
jgi:hypothetical protein